MYEDIFERGVTWPVGDAKDCTGVHVQASEDQLRVLMIGGLDGDADAYAALLSALVPLLRSFFGRRLRGANHDAEDLMQETLMAVHSRRATYDRARPFAPWLFAVARHKMVDHFRRTRQHATMEGLEDILAIEGFEASSNARLDVATLLDGLPAKQAAVIRDTKLDGLSIVETAEGRRLSEADVKVSVHRGLKALAMRIRGDG